MLNLGRKKNYKEGDKEKISHQKQYKQEEHDHGISLKYWKKKIWPTQSCVPNKNILKMNKHVRKIWYKAFPNSVPCASQYARYTPKLWLLRHFLGVTSFNLFLSPTM